MKKFNHCATGAFLKSKTCGNLPYVGYFAAEGVTNMATSSRLDFRVDTKSKRLIEQAAAVVGQSISDFAKSTLLSKARNVLRQHRETVLSDRDRDIFLAPCWIQMPNRTLL